MNPVLDEAIERAHSVIREFVRSRHSMAREDAGGLLDVLELALPPHFAYEERAGGFFDRLRGNGVPSKVVDRLLADHSELLGLLSEARREYDAGGPAVDERLDLLARQMRDHEWLESASAARIGVPVPSEPGARPAPRGLPTELAAAIDPLAREILDRVSAARDSFLAAVTLGLPETAPVEHVIEAFEHALSVRGLDFVDVDAVTSGGPPRILATRFDPGWS